MNIFKSVYNPPKNKSTKAQTLEEIYSSKKVTTFSLARFALKEALIMIGISKGDKILVPEYICKDVIDVIAQIGGVVVFYPITPDLKPVMGDDLASAKALIAVNYFGFPVDLNLFKNYLLKNPDCEIIEDNAHGFLSEDADGRLLGARTKYGMISLRKTIPTPNGGILLSSEMRTSLQVMTSVPKSFRIKNFLRPFISLLSGSCWLFTMSCFRRARPIKNTDSSLAEYSPNPFDLNYYVGLIDFDLEKKRRKDLYLFLEKYLGHAIFKSLPVNVVPQCYPFRILNNEIDEVRKKLFKLGLEMYLWPELPEEIANRINVPDYYKNVWCVRFLW